MASDVPSACPIPSDQLIDLVERRPFGFAPGLPDDAASKIAEPFDFDHASGAGQKNLGEGFTMAQLYLQRFEYRAANKSEFDQAWVTALQTFARTGNWGDAETGVRHIKSYGTAWGGYALIEVDDADAFGRYQLHHAMSYGHMCDITFEPLFDLDAALAQRVHDVRS